MPLESGITQAPSTENTDPLNDPNYADPLIDESLKKKQEVCDKNISMTEYIILLEFWQFLHKQLFEYHVIE